MALLNFEIFCQSALPERQSLTASCDLIVRVCNSHDKSHHISMYTSIPNKNIVPSNDDTFTLLKHY